MTLPTNPPTALLVSCDLFFTSRITGTAAELGIAMRVAADDSSAAREAAATDFRCIFLDLADSSLDVTEFIALLKPDRRPPVIAFGSHVATARLEAARDAGCDEVLPRSRFSTSLPELLRKYCGLAE